MAAVSVKGSFPFTGAVRSPEGAGVSPIWMTWAPARLRDPRGDRAFSAVAVTSGSDPGPESSSGARTGPAMKTEAASAASQSSLGASTTAGGLVPGAAEGYTANATPAASAVGSLPGTLVVFFVAVSGMPRPGAGELVAVVVVVVVVAGVGGAGTVTECVRIS